MKPNQAKEKLSVRMGRAFRRYFIAGLAALFPVTVTIYLLVVIFRFADAWASKLFGFYIPGLGLLLTVLIILVVGFLSTHFLGRMIFPALDALAGRVPLVKNIYPAVKQLTGFLFGDGSGKPALQRVAMIEYPRPGSYTLAFVTHEEETSVTGKPTTLVTLLVPTPPSPFSGPLIFLPKDQVIPLTISVEDALKLIVSGGVVSSPLLASPRQPLG